MNNKVCSKMNSSFVMEGYMTIFIFSHFRFPTLYMSCIQVYVDNRSGSSPFRCNGHCISHPVGISPTFQER